MKAGSIPVDATKLSVLLPQGATETPTVVSNVVAATDRIAFSVDQVGTPVLVRASYFPNWSAKGADGPYRVAPNFMVVVPTSTDVELVFERKAVDWLAILLTVLGVAAVGGLLIRPAWRLQDVRRTKVIESEPFDHDPENEPDDVSARTLAEDPASPEERADDRFRLGE